MAKIGAKAGWHGNYVESITAAKTLVAGDSGKVFMVSDPGSAGYTITLPLPADAGAGFTAKFIISTDVLSDGAGEDVIMTDGTKDKMVINYIDSADADASSNVATSVVHDLGADTIGFDHTAVKGDFIDLFTDGTTWYGYGISGVNAGVLVAS